MSVGADNIGRSEFTENKHADLRDLLLWHARMCSGIISRHGGQYQFIDLNCGDGAGSPAIAIETVSPLVSPAHFFFCDIEPGNTLLTRQRHGHLSNVTVATDDHTKAAPIYARGLRGRQSGVVFHDPNGVPNFPLLSDLSRIRVMQHMDFIVYFAANGYKRARLAPGSKLPLLSDAVKTVDKRYWLIRTPMGPWQWSFLLGTNWAGFQSWERRGYHKLDSPVGRDIAERLELSVTERTAKYQIPLLPSPDAQPYASYAEYLRHPQFLAVRQQAMDRAAGLCERCGQRPPTEPHHLRYPKWGTFDVPENLIAVCHECHADIHGKVN